MFAFTPVRTIKGYKVILCQTMKGHAAQPWYTHTPKQPFFTPPDLHIQRCLFWIVGGRGNQSLADHIGLVLAQLPAGTRNVCNNSSMNKALQ